MKKIKLTQNKVALVDNSDYEKINKYKWCLFHHHNTFYAVRNSKKSEGRKRRLYMHRVIAGTPEDKETDHINGDGLNNQRKNLRICNHSENQRNKSRYKSNTSGYKGVFWHNIGKKWLASIRIKGIQKHLGLFKTKIEAYEAYCIACKKHHGEFSKII